MPRVGISAPAGGGGAAGAGAPFCSHTQVGESSVCSRLHKAGCFQQACSWPSKPSPRAHFPLPCRHVSSQLPVSSIFAIVDLLVTTPRSRLGSWRHIHPWRREAEPAFWVCITLQSSLPFQQPVSFHPATAMRGVCSPLPVSATTTAPIFS